MVCHVSDGVATSVRLAESTHDDCIVRVDRSPRDDEDGAWYRAESDHGRRNRQDTGGKDDFEEDERRFGPRDGSVVYTALDLLEHLCGGSA